MTKRIQITDLSTGEVVLDTQTSDYHLQYTEIGHDVIRRLGRINNARFGRYKIRNGAYFPILAQLIDKFRELQHIRADEILVLVDEDWVLKRQKNPWMANIAVARMDLAETWGYRYVLTIRKFFTDRMSRAQIIMLLYHKLRHIGADGSLVPHTIEDFSNIVGTVGPRWYQEHKHIENILDNDFEGWTEIRGPQMSLFEPAEQASNVVDITAGRRSS